MWQDAECLAPEAAESSCAKRTFFSIRLPVEAYRDAIFLDPRAPWPPKAFEKTGVRLEMFGPASERAIFDSAKPGATPPFSWSELAASLSAGETLSVRRIGKDVVSFTPILRLKGAEEPGVQPAWWISQLIARLPLGPGAKSSAVQEAINTYVGRYEVSLEGDVRAVERNLAATVTRLSWFIGAMLAAIVLAWFIIEMGLIRRISLLTKRAATLSHSVNVNTALVGELEVADLRGKDELGILAGGLADLLQRVKTDVKREQIRAEQERDMWHAVGHEIMSPLQSLMVLHGKESDSSHRYVKRMQQAVKVLYGSASPSEAIEASHLQMAGLDLVAFLQHVAANAHYAGIEAVEFKTELTQVQVNGDEYSLEDVMTHLLSNANRLRLPNTVIEIVLSASANEALITVFNQGPQIVPEALEQIFAYGVSSSDASNEHRGQGLFVAKTYVAKMQGSIKARNIDALLDHGAMRAGVAFDIRIPKIIETVSGRF